TRFALPPRRPPSLHAALHYAGPARRHQGMRGRAIDGMSQAWAVSWDDLMVTNRCLVAAVLAVTSIPAGASIAVIGASSARLCYEAADAASLPTRRDFQRCTEALDEVGITRHDLV